MQRFLEVISFNGISEDVLTKQEAFSLFGRTTVERRIKEKLITVLKIDGVVLKKCIDINKLFAIPAKNNRISYLPVAER